MKSLKRGKTWWKERIWSESLLKGAKYSFIKSESLPSLFTYLKSDNSERAKSVYTDMVNDYADTRSGQQLCGHMFFANIYAKTKKVCEINFACSFGA